jgi:uncharacterized membrane protein
MPFFVFLLICGVILCVVAGVVGFVLSINALGECKRLRKKLEQLSAGAPIEPAKSPAPLPATDKEGASKVEAEAQRQKAIEAAKIAEQDKMRKAQAKEVYAQMREEEEKVSCEKKVSIEQMIGTKWLAIAGIITVIVGVGFFLKYAYDNSLVGPLGRVVIATMFGMAGLVVGEITRRRGFGLVAKVVTAMGFAVLYLAVFSAHRFYELIDSAPAFIVAIAITAAAMLYAVSLNEIVIAILAIGGGFAAPVIVATGQNVPNLLFAYVLILGFGAMICAYYRRWRAINLLAMAGTYALYAGWFTKFLVPHLRDEGFGQRDVALIWVGVFFVFYLVLPLLHILLRKVKSAKEDVVLVVANAAVTFYYLWLMLFDNYRVWLAYSAVVLCLAHLVLLAVVNKRKSDDTDLRISLLVIGLFFLTMAVPLYLRMYGTVLAWSLEAFVLTVIGLRYRSVLTLRGGAAALVLSVGKLIYLLPLHVGAFRLVFNPAFGSWMFVVGVVMVLYWIYRKSTATEKFYKMHISQVLYIIGLAIFFLAAGMEWYYRCDYNVAWNAPGRVDFLLGLMLMFAAGVLLLLFRPVAPAGMICVLAAVGAGLIGSMYTLAVTGEIYRQSFAIFVNSEFAIALIFIASVFGAAKLISRRISEQGENKYLSMFLAFLGVVAVWILFSEQIYLFLYCKNRYAEKVMNWSFMANMYISVFWAIYAVVLMAGGFWRKISGLRYMSLALFGLLLLKVFIMDMSTVKSVYRIAAFMATGITLVGVSYSYQYLKKRNFFEPTKKTEDIS